MAELRLKQLLDDVKRGELAAIEARFKQLRAGFEWENLPVTEIKAMNAAGKP